MQQPPQQQQQQQQPPPQQQPKPIPRQRPQIKPRATVPLVNVPPGAENYEYMSRNGVPVADHVYDDPSTSLPRYDDPDLISPLLASFPV